VEVIEGKAFIKGRLRDANIGIENGKIVKIKKVLYGKAHNYKGMVILPAAIDIHVHFREPGYEYKEDFYTGSKAALLSGVTFVADMPNNNPLIVDDTTFKEKLNKIKRKAWVDYGLYAGISKKLVRDANLYKLYLSHDNDIFVGYDELKNLFQKIKEKNALLAIHAEDENCIKREGKNLVEYEKNSPVECEIKAVKKIVEINKEIKARLHICHVTSPETARILNKSKTSFGVTLHHILFSYKSKFKREAMGKVNPPLRSEEEREKLFKMVAKGKVPIMESDHAPHAIEEKNGFQEAKAGMPGVDALLPIMLYMVKMGKIKLGNLVRMVSENPARLIGINKGKIEVGKDADFIIIDFNDVKKMKALSKCGWSCYEGMNAIYPYHVWLRGEIVMENGEVIGEPTGRRIK